MRGPCVTGSAASFQHFVCHKDGLFGLDRFKKGMSGWWKNIERHFHQLRMASLLSKEDLDDDGASQIKQQLKSNGRTGWIASLRNTASLSGSKVTAGLRDIKHAMQVEVEKMEAAGRVLGKMLERHGFHGPCFLVNSGIFSKA